MKTRGANLIELMTALGIASILAAVAVPAYRDYTLRGQVTEAISLGNGWKAKVQEYYVKNGAMPTGCPDTTNFPDQTLSNIDGISQIRWCGLAPQRIEVWLPNFYDSVIRQVWLVPTLTEDSITWQCGTHPDSAYLLCKHLPSNCQLNCRTS